MNKISKISNKQDLVEMFAVYANPRIISIFFLGFSSGLPLALTASTLGVWLAESGVSKAAIGIFAAVATPYSLKFLWSPLMDGTLFPLLSARLGRRRGWMIATQLMLVVFMVAMGFSDPSATPWLTAVFALCVAIASASQDIVIDAYRIEILTPKQYGAGAAMIVLGSRIGALVSSAGALYLASYWNWQTAYGVMALLMGVGMITVLCNKEPPAADAIRRDQPRSLTHWCRDHVVAPFSEFSGRSQWASLLLFVLLYKFADAFMGVMASPFYIEIGFTKEQIASIVKLYGVAATIIGSFIGGAMVVRFGLLPVLWIGGLGQGLTNYIFVLLAQAGGPDTQLLAGCITLDNIFGGLGTAAFVAFLSSLTNVRFTATQYALLSSFAAFGRTWLSTPAGWFAEHLGWESFFILSVVLAVPGLLLLWWLARKLDLHRREGFTATSLPVEETLK